MKPSNFASTHSSSVMPTMRRWITLVTLVIPCVVAADAATASVTAPVAGSINRWVETQTRDRIKDLIPAGRITRDTRLVLANAIYLKAAWAEEFQPEPRMPF